VMRSYAWQFIKKMREEKGYERVGAVGYCFGGYIAVRVGATDFVDTVVIAHPGGINAEHIKAIKVRPCANMHLIPSLRMSVQVPASWVCAEGTFLYLVAVGNVLNAPSEDSSFKPALRNQAEEIFVARKDKPDFIDYEFKDWKGTSPDLSSSSCAHENDIQCRNCAWVCDPAQPVCPGSESWV
jgi:carboxymethylenebutenolidase